MSAKGEKDVKKLVKKVKKLEFEEQDIDVFVSLPMKDQSGTELGYVVIELSKEYLLTQTANARNFTIMMALIILAGSMSLGYYIVRSIVNNIKSVISAADAVSRGDLNIALNIKANDETKLLGASIITTIDTLKGLISEIDLINNAALEGKLDKRGNTTKFQGAYSEIVSGINNSMNSIIAPLNVAAEYIDRIAKGDIPPKITDEYQGDFNEIKNNLNQCIDSINLLISDANSLADAAILGDVKKRADIAKHNGGYRKIIQGFNNTLDAVLAPIEESVAILEQMAKGDLSQLMEGEFRGDHAVLKQALNGTLVSINELLSQVAETVDQVLSGSSQVANTSQNLSSGASEQAAAIEQMSSSMMEIAAQTKQNAEKCYEC